MNKHLRLLKDNTSGFTFVELLVVIVIMAVLVAATANYLFSQGGSKARDIERKNEMRQTAALIEQFVGAYGEPPSDITKNKKIARVTECTAVSDYKTLMKCFEALKYAQGEGLKNLAEDPKEGIESDPGANIYMYLYKGTNNGWKICALLENQTDPDLNDNYTGSGVYEGTAEGSRTYCVVSSNRKLTEITGVQGSAPFFEPAQ